MANNVSIFVVYVVSLSEMEVTVAVRDVVLESSKVVMMDGEDIIVSA